MTVQTAEWFDYQGLKHAFRPTEHGERATWCGLVAAEVELTTATADLCVICAMSHGGELATHHGANVHRAPDPDAVSSGDDDTAVAG